MVVKHAETSAEAKFLEGASSDLPHILACRSQYNRSLCYSSFHECNPTDEPIMTVSCSVHLLYASAHNSCDMHVPSMVHDLRTILILCKCVRWEAQATHEAFWAQARALRGSARQS